MPRVPAAAIALILVVGPLPALAQDAAAPAAGSPEPPALTRATATWTEGGQVQLDVTFDGSACQQPGEAEVISADGSMLDHVTIPTTRTSEVCTLQLAPVTYSGLIAVEPHTQTLEITVLDPDGDVQAAGNVAIAPAETTAPAEEPAEGGEDAPA